MKFLAITLITHVPDPVTGIQKSTTERLRDVVENAVLAEELGFDGYGVGERHERPFISSSPPVVLSHIAARTSTIRLFTTVTTLSLLDPVRAFEDYATLDHLSGGRLELIIGKGNGAAQARAVPCHRRGSMGAQSRGLRAVPPAVAGGQGDLVRPVPSVAGRGRDLAAPVAAADPGLARQRDQQGFRGSGRQVGRSAVLGERHQSHRAVRRPGPVLPGTLGVLRSRSRGRVGRRRHRRLLRAPRRRRKPSRRTARSSRPGWRRSAGGVCSRCSTRSRTPSSAVRP